MGPNPASWLFTSLIPHPHKEWQMWDACLLCFLESPPTSMAVTSLFTSMAGNISFHSSFWWKVSLQLSPILTASLPFPLRLILVHSGYCNSWFQWWPEQKATRGEGLNFPGFSIKVLVPFSLFEVDFIPLQAWEQELWGNLEDGYGQIEEIWAKQGEAG